MKQTQSTQYSRDVSCQPLRLGICTLLFWTLVLQPVTGIAAGVRRIEAFTGLGALDHLREQERTLRRIGEILKVPAEEAVRPVEPAPAAATGGDGK